MSDSTNKLTPLQIVDSHTYNKAQEIFNKTVNNKLNQQQNTKIKLNSENYLLPKTKKLKIVRKISSYSLKKSLLSFSLKQPSKQSYIKSVRIFYKGYKLYLYSLLLFINLKFAEQDESFTKKLRSKKKFEQTYLRQVFQKLTNIDRTYLTILKKNLKNLKNSSVTKITSLKKVTILRYKKYLRRYHQSLFFLNLVYKTDNYLANIYRNLVQQFNSQSILFHGISTKFNLEKYTKLLTRIKQTLLNLLSLEKKQLILILERFGLIIGIYFLPFIFLATQALVPLIDEYEYLIINPVSSFIFGKIPFLIELIKLLRPIITNPMLLFWVPLGYYLTFTSAYRSLKISYKVAYNGTIAAIFLIINYSCFLMQFMMKLAFDSIKIVKDIFFTSYLIKHLGKNKNKERDEAMKIFATLVGRYDSEIRKNYYEFLLLINHRLFSHLALISLAALVYNCIYYIIHNKNPEIILVTKTALATIKNPQEEE